MSRKKQKKSKTPAQGGAGNVEPHSGPKFRVAFEWGRSIAIAVGLAMLIRWPVAEPFKIPSGSMEPTFYGGDRIFVNKHAYGIRYPFNGFRIPYTRTTIWYSDSYLWRSTGPERWDIVVFKSVETGAEHDTLVKRVVGLPGERVRIDGSDGRLYIDGIPVELPRDMPPVTYTFEPSSNGYGLAGDDEHARVPAGHYFLLGDNSPHSRDARWFGWVPGHHILGKVSSIWWPVSRWRDLTGFSRSWWWIGTWMCIGASIFVRLFVGRSYHVRQSLLGDALAANDRMFVRFAFGLRTPLGGLRLTRGRDPARGDLVLYRSGSKDENMRLGIVAGLPGEQVYISGGTLYVNDDESKTPALLKGLGLSLGGDHGVFGGSKGREYSLVPEGHFYVLVDDGSGELDSRKLGWISRDAIVGRVTHRWWPAFRWGRLRPGSTA